MVEDREHYLDRLLAEVLAERRARIATHLHPFVPRPRKRRPRPKTAIIAIHLAKFNRAIVNKALRSWQV